MRDGWETLFRRRLGGELCEVCVCVCVCVQRKRRDLQSSEDMTSQIRPQRIVQARLVKYCSSPTCPSFLYFCIGGDIDLNIRAPGISPSLHMSSI